MALILSIETATRVCSVALHQDSKLLAVQELFIEKSHSGQLTLLIKDILQYCEITFDAIDAVAVSKGPGSYTGLRIGTSTAKGLCFSLDIPLIAINTLEAMAYEMMKYNTEKALLCPMVDARRMEVYCLVKDHDFNTIEATSAKIIDEDSFQELLSERKMILFGDGASKCIPYLGKISNALFVHDVKPSASGVGALAWSKYQHQKFENIAYFEPYYLKDFKVNKPKAK